MESFDEVLALASEKQEGDVNKMLANGEGTKYRPCRSRTCDTLTKSPLAMYALN